MNRRGFLSTLVGALCAAAIQLDLVKPIEGFHFIEMGNRLGKSELQFMEYIMAEIATITGIPTWMQDDFK